MATKNSQNINWAPLFKYLDDNYVTKQDVKKILNEESRFWITKIENLTAMHKITNLVLKRMGNTISSKQDLVDLREELTKRFSHLPTKEEFYKKMDKWMKATSIAEMERPLHKRDHEQIRKFLRTSSVL